jgi:CheY-like chemotaxis protein
MKLFSHDAERILFEKAKSLSAQHDSWRCLYINFSDERHEYSEGLRTHIVTNILKELLEDEYGYIYLCGDGDVFILFQGKVQPILNKIGEQFRGIGGRHSSMQPEDELYTLLDLSKHWQLFFTLCKNKLPPETSLPSQPLKPAVAASPKLLPMADPELFVTAAAARSSRERLLVLLVEDDPFTRKLAASTLKGQYDVIEAGDAAEALRIYNKMAPDVVFLDIELPDASGHVVLGRLLTLDPSAFIAMLSANSIKENILAALEKGAKGFVTKPFAKEKLLHYLQLCMSQKQSSVSHHGATA